MTKKRGPISSSERSYIEQFLAEEGIVTVAHKLNRDPETIKKYAEKKLGMDVKGRGQTLVAAEFDIRHRPYWGELEAQFDKPELDSIVFEWGRMVEQFGGDVQPTEESQILDAIKLQILMNRNLREQKEATVINKILTAELNEEDVKEPEHKDKTKIAMLSMKIANIQAALSATGKAYRELQDRKNKMLESLKATRQQRIQRIEDSKQNFIGWLTQILSDEHLRRSLGVNMEKMRLAAVKEMERLAKPHTYDDGMVDSPMLLPETVVGLQEGE